MALSNSVEYDYRWINIRPYEFSKSKDLLNLEFTKKIWIPVYYFNASNRFFDDERAKEDYLSQLIEALERNGLNIDDLGLGEITLEDLTEKKNEIVKAFLDNLDKKDDKSLE